MTDTNCLTKTVAMYGRKEKRTVKKFYKSVNPEVNQTWEKYLSDANTVLESFREFATHFDAEPQFSSGVNGAKFYGLILNDFESREDSDLWTKPTDKTGNSSRPRARVKGKENMARLRVLKSRYDELMPSSKATTLDDVYKAMGTDWGNIAMCGIHWFASDGAVYAATQATLNDSMEEITGSEFEQAQQQYKAAA